MKKKESHIFFSIRSRVGISYLLIILVPFLIVGLAANYYMVRSSVKKEADSIASSISTTELYINEILSIAEQYYYIFSTDIDMIKSAQEIVNPDDISSFSDLENINKIYSSIESFVNSAPHIQSIYLYNSNTKAFYLSSKSSYYNKQIMALPDDDISFNLDKKDIESSNWYTYYKSLNTNQAWFLTDDIKPNSNNPKLLAFCSSLRFGREDAETIMSVNISETQIKEILSNIRPNNSAIVSIIDSSGSIISSTNNSLLGAKVEQTDYYNLYNTINEDNTKSSNEIIINEEKYLLIGYFSTNHEWVYIVQTPYNAVIQTANQSRNILIALYIAIAFLVIISLSFTVPLFYEPLERLINGMKKIETGDFDVRLPEVRHDEYGYIFRQFNTTVSSLQNLIKENYTIAIEKNTITMKYIQSQINKHFLFNTLNIINWKVREGDTALGADAIVTLSNFFRLSLNYGEDFLPVSEVCNMLQYYSELIELRYPQKYSIKINYDSKISHAQILKIIFQPILENSLQHGLGKKGGNIEINFVSQENGILFSICDNGAGMNEEQIQSIIESFSNPVKKYENFALKSINRLLELVYKDTYYFNIKSKLNAGTTIEIFMPVYDGGIDE